jgi:hypothetical protein
MVQSVFEAFQAKIEPGKDWEDGHGNDWHRYKYKGQDIYFGRFQPAAEGEQMKGLTGGNAKVPPPDVKKELKSNIRYCPD